MAKNKNSRKQSSPEGSPQNAESLSDVRACSKCGTDVVRHALYCHACGHPTSASAMHGKEKPRIGIYALAVIAAVTVTFVASSFVFWPIVMGEQITPDRDRSPSAQPLASNGSPPDLSKMSPREAADRLFNRVMAATEQGNNQMAERFLPMAIQAYGLVPRLDADGRYHLALLHLFNNDPNAALEQAKTIKQTIPKHLLATTIEHEAAKRLNRDGDQEKAISEFKDAFNTEMSSNRTEYSAHQSALLKFRSQIGGIPSNSVASSNSSGIRDGENLFLAKCAICHGKDARGTKSGPPLIHKYYEPSHHNDESFQTAVKNGVKQHHWNFGNMPPVGGLDRTAVGKIIAYIRQTQRQNGIF